MNKMIPHKLLWVLGILLVVTFSCEKEEPVPEGPPFSLSSIAPYSGYEGTLIGIYGNGFRTSASENKVEFNGVEATIKSVTETKLEVEVPSGATTGKIAVTIDGYTIKSGNNFTVLPKPAIESFSPLSGYVGNKVTIKGSAFSATAADILVEFNGTAATVESAKTTELVVVVPEGVSTGKISVTVDGQTGISTQEFKLNSDHWTRKADFSGTMGSGGVAFTIGNKGYVGTGEGGNESVLKEFWEYDPATDVWTQKADLPGMGRTAAVGFSFSMGNVGYVGSGSSSPTSKISDLVDFWEYNSPINEWIQKSDFPGGARVDAVAFSIGSKAYLGTGFLDGTRMNDLWEYDPLTDTWIQKADLPGPSRNGAVSFSIGTKGYIGTGTGEGSTSLRDFWEYDPSTDSWTQKADFGGIARTDALGFSLGTKGYIGTGTVSFNDEIIIGRSFYYKDFWDYDPATDTWTRKADLGDRTNGGVGFAVDNKAYVKTGTQYDHVNNKVWEYSPE